MVSNFWFCIFQGNCCWESVSGKTVTLTGSSLIHLTELERLVLQKIAHARLQALQLGCSIHIPKGKGPFTFKKENFVLPPFLMNFFKFIFRGHQPFLWGLSYPCFWISGHVCPSFGMNLSYIAKKTWLNT